MCTKNIFLCKSILLPMKGQRELMCELQRCATCQKNVSLPQKSVLSSLVSGSNQQPAQVESSPGSSTVEPSLSRVETRGEKRRGLRVRTGLLRRCDRKHPAATPPLHSAFKYSACRQKVDFSSYCNLQDRSVRYFLYFCFFFLLLLLLINILYIFHFCERPLWQFSSQPGHNALRPLLPETGGTAD